MKVLHLLTAGNAGGIEVLARNYSQHSLHDNVFYFFWNGGAVAEEMENAGMRVVFGEAEQSGSFACLKRLRLLCKQEKPEVIIVHHAAPLLKIAALWLKCMTPKLQIIMYAHGCAESICVTDKKKGLWLRRPIQSLAFKKADGVIAISNAVKESLVRYLRVKPEKISVIYNGVPIRQIQQKRIVSAPVRLVYVGRLVKEKGVQTTLRALSQIAGRVNFTFDIVGEGPYGDALKSMVKELSLEDRVSFLGMRLDVLDLLATSDIFVHVPVCEEGFGITVVEAMSAGCVCVCGRKGGIPEIINDGQDGYLVQSSTVEELADVLTELLPRYLAGECSQTQNNAILRAKDFSIVSYSEKLDAYIKFFGQAGIG